jgi:hypothetical protein
MSASNSATKSPPSPTVIVKAGSPVLALVVALIIGLGAFYGGMYFERTKHADYTVRVSGVPERITVVGAPDNITVGGIPERIQIVGGVQGIPDSITLKGTSLEGILPKGVDVRTAATAVVDNRHILAVTPRGFVYMVYYSDIVGWEVKQLVGP